MLSDKEVMATVAVKDIEVARAFYQDKLGLEPTDGDQPTDVLSYKCGKSTLLVYESRYAGTNQATAATWVVGDDVKGAAQALKGKGVRFEHYDFPDTTRDGDVHVFGDLKAAWFKDPDGNILSIVSG